MKALALYKRYPTGFGLLLLVLLALAVTLPFTGQAIHVDARLFIDWAKQGIEHPLWQHLPDYDYFGVHYDQFHDTHPRLQSLYLGLFLRLNGGEVSEPLLHLAMIPFPLVAVTSFFFLARRFRADPLLAGLLLVVAPAFLVNTHLIMTDVPGVAFWLAGITCFVYGVDRRGRLLLAAAALFFTICIFIYYQGLSVLPLAFLYLVVKRRVSAGPVTALALPAALFVAYVSAHIAYYGQPPTFSYPFGLPLDPFSVLVRFRGTLVLAGGALVFPVAALYIFLHGRAVTYVAAACGVVATLWMAVLYVTGVYPVEHMIILPLLLAAGIAVVWWFGAAFAGSLVPGLAGRSGGDRLFLSTWFLGTFFYCFVLLPYPSPRHMIPLLPPLAIVAARRMEELWGGDGRRLLKATLLVVASTLALALAVAVGEHLRADNNREVARVASERVDQLGGGTVWFNGGLGFQYYVQPLGWRMLILDSDEPAPGDLIVESVGNNRWYFDWRLKERIELVDTIDFPRRWPLVTEFIECRISWLGQIGNMVPYGFSGDYEDRVYIYRVTGEQPALRPLGSYFSGIDKDDTSK